MVRGAVRARGGICHSSRGVIDNVENHHGTHLQHTALPARPTIAKPVADLRAVYDDALILGEAVFFVVVLIIDYTLISFFGWLRSCCKD